MKIIFVLNNQQQLCIEQDEEVINEFNNGNINQFIINDGILNIPCGVKVIEQQIQNYENKQSISIVNIPDSVVYIGESSFSNCTGIINVTMQNSIIEIDSNAFLNCTSLQKINLSNQLKYIGNSTFYGCSNLQSIIIPDSVTHIGNNTFYDCYNLQYVKLSNSIKILNDQTFYNCSSLKQIFIPNSVITIGTMTFYKCNNLVNITIPQSVKEIYIGAFQYCSSLNCLSILNEQCDIRYNSFDSTKFSNTYNETKNSSSYCIDENYYNYCDNETYKYIYNLNTPDICIREEYVYLYYINEQQQRISVQTCPEQYSFINIDSEPYQCIDECLNNIYGIYCSQYDQQDKINTIFSLDNIEYFIDNETLNIPEGIQVLTQEIDQYQKKDAIKNFIIPNSLIGIGEQGFNYTNIEQIILPENLQVLGQKSFQQCESLIKVQFTSNKIRNLYNYTFYYCKNLINISGLNNVQRIQQKAFYECNNLEYIDTTDKLEYIDQDAFYQCSSLQSIDISKVSYIGKSAFKYCYNITSFTLSTKLTIITDSVFSYCQSLQYINIPQSVIQIDQYAFEYCSQLDCIAILNSNCNISQDAFKGSHFQDNYTDYIGEDKRCFEEGYDYCNQTDYDYIADINDLLTCTTIDNVQYFYKTEINEKEINVRVESCQQIGYQYQIKGNPIECVENCNGYTYIQEQYCVNECDEEHEFIQNNECVMSCINDYAHPEDDSKVCDNQCQYHIEGNYKYCDSICNEPYQYHAALSRDQCVSNCSETSLNYSQLFECVSECTNNYAYPNDTQSNICDNTCLYYNVNTTTKQCVLECQSPYQYLVDEDKDYCIDDCNKTENKKYVQEQQCIQQCTDDYAQPESQNGNICDNECQYYQINEFKYCMSNCTGDYKYHADLDRDQCVSNCSQTELIYQLNNTCLQQCPQDYKPNSNNQCIVKSNQATLAISITIPIVVVIIIIVVIIIVVIKKRKTSQKCKINSSDHQQGTIQTDNLQNIEMNSIYPLSHQQI